MSEEHTETVIDTETHGNSQLQAGVPSSPTLIDRMERMEAIVAQLSQEGGTVSLTTRLTHLEAAMALLPTAAKLAQRHQVLMTLYSFAGRFWRLPPFPKDDVTD